MKKLYLFDFDGTISTKDSMIYFFYFIHPKFIFFTKFIHSSIYVIIYLLRIRSKDETKSKVLEIFLGEFSKNELIKHAKNFVPYFSKFIRESSKDYIKNNVKNDPNNAQAFIVSASMDIWIDPIASHLNLNAISTKSLFINEKFYGIDGNNCNNQQKAIRIKEEIDLDKFDLILAFGNSKADQDMLDLADKKFYNYFS
tara:strand:+ start:1985 stop:2578 length:594 start_codon:yes stop_codon:yes gene_type:complete